MNWTGLAKRLEGRLGLGEFPMIRKRLYSRVERTCQQHGDAAYAIVVDCVNAAVTKNKPGNWFSSAITRRLAEAGFLKQGGGPNEVAPNRAPETLVQSPAAVVSDAAEVMSLARHDAMVAELERQRAANVKQSLLERAAAYDAKRGVRNDGF